MIDSNPFQLLTLIVPPAILTNASSVLTLGTSNRFARVVDRARFVSARLGDAGKLSDKEADFYRKQLPTLGRRSLLLVKALTCFYSSVGAFAATAFISIIGAALAYLEIPTGEHVAVVIAIISGLVGVGGLVGGTGMLVREMTVAHRLMIQEVEFSESMHVNPLM